MKQRPGFMLYFEGMSALSAMEDAEAGALFKALMAYAQWGEVRELTGLAAFAFEMMRGRLDRDAEAYAEKCRKNTYYSYVSAAKRRGEVPLEYEEWNEGTVRDPIQPNAAPDTNAVPITNAAPTPAINKNTTVFSNTKQGRGSSALPAQDSDTAWVLPYLAEREKNRQGGAECRNDTRN